jgi:membrane protease YdiL (CAAX protease family)
MPELPDHSPPTTVRGWLEIASIFLLMPLGGILGGLTGFIPASAIGSVLVPLIAATLYLRHEGCRWRSLALGRSLGVRQVLGYLCFTLVATWLLVSACNLLLRSAGLPPPDFSVFEQILDGDRAMYLWLLIPVGWGSAAIGEELLARGFLLHRLEGLSGTAPAVILQAAIFAGGHFYQDLAGVLNVFVLALVFGAVYLKAGRNLLPLILAHGTIDTVSITLLYQGYGELLAG